MTYWNAVRADRTAPVRGEIEPKALRDILPSVFILECTVPGESRFRLAGTGLCGLFARELRGMRFDGLWRSEQNSRVERIVEQVMATARPVTLSAVSCGTGSDIRQPVEITLLPLASVPGRIDRIIGVLEPIAQRADRALPPIVYLDLTGLRETDLSVQPEDDATIGTKEPGQPDHFVQPNHSDRTASRVLRLRVLEGGRRD